MSDDILDEVRDETGNDDSEGEEEMGDIPRPFSAPESGDHIGHISVQDDTVTVGREENQIRAFINTDRREGVRMGNYVRIPYPAPESGGPPQMLFGVITQLEYAAATEITDRRDGGYSNPPGEHEFSYLASIKPISIVNYDPDFEEMQQNTVDKPPKPGAGSYLVESDEFLRTGLRIPQQGAFLGHMAVSGDRIPSEEDPLPYYLFNPNATDGNEDEGEPAIFRHIQVAGSTGKGKTHFSKNVLRQLVTDKRYTIEVPPEEREEGGPDERQRGLNVCIIDPEDEYVEMRDDPLEEDLPPEQAEEYRDQGIAVGGIESDPDVDCEVFAPLVAGTEPDIDDYTGFGIPFSIVEDHPSLLFKADPPERTAAAISETISRYFTETPEDQQTYAHFSQWVDQIFMDGRGDQIVENESVQVAVTDRLVDQNEYHRIFDTGNRMLDELTPDMFRGQQVTVFPTGHLRGTVDKLVVSALLSHIVQNKIGSRVDYPQIKGTPMLLALDEAHEYVSSTEDSRERYLVNQYRRAAKRGRKDLLGLYNITQNPADIDEEISEQTNTRIYLGLERDVAESHDVYVPQDFVNQVTQFGKGQAVVKQPDVRPVEIIGLPHCVTRH